MRISKTFLIASAVALSATPALAQATTPAPVVGIDRVGASTDENSEVAGGTGIILAILAAAAVITGILIATDVIGGGDDPVSP